MTSYREARKKCNKNIIAVVIAQEVVERRNCSFIFYDLCGFIYRSHCPHLPPFPLHAPPIHSVSSQSR